MRNLSKNTIKRGTKILNTSNDNLLRGIWKVNLLRVPQGKTIGNAFETAAFVLNCLVQKEAELRSLVAPKFENGGYFNSATMEYIVPRHLLENKEMPPRFLWDISSISTKKYEI